MAPDIGNAVVILDRLIDPDSTPEAGDPVQMLLDLRFSAADLKRMNRLAGKARAGTLTAQDRAALDSYELIGHMLSLLKSKARRIRKKSANGA